MRSRTRNRPLLLAIFLLIILSSAWGDDYLIGYRLMTHNASVQYENLSISRSMTPCIGKRQAPVSLDRLPNESFKALLNRHETTFLEYTSNQPLSLKSHQVFASDIQETKESLTLPTQCYAVEFNDEFVTISLLK